VASSLARAATCWSATGNSQRPIEEDWPMPSSPVRSHRLHRRPICRSIPLSRFGRSGLRVSPFWPRDHDVWRRPWMGRQCQGLGNHDCHLSGARRQFHRHRQRLHQRPFREDHRRLLSSTRCRKPALNFPADINNHVAPMFAFPGTTTDGYTPPPSVNPCCRRAQIGTSQLRSASCRLTSSDILFRRPRVALLGLVRAVGTRTTRRLPSRDLDQRSK